MHRWGVILLLMVPMLWYAALPCRAAEERGTIRVELEPDMADSTVVLHRVGGMRAEGLELCDSLGGGYVAGDDLYTGALLRWLAERAEGGTEKRIARDGTAMFSDLEEGVYLLNQEEGSPGYYAMEPVLIVLPEADGSWYAKITPDGEEIQYRAPETGGPVPPVLSAMGMVLSGYFIGIWYENWHKQRRNRKTDPQNQYTNAE